MGWCQELGYPCGIMTYERAHVDSAPQSGTAPNPDVTFGHLRASTPKGWPLNKAPSRCSVGWPAAPLDIEPWALPTEADGIPPPAGTSECDHERAEAGRRVCGEPAFGAVVEASWRAGNGPSESWTCKEVRQSTFHNLGQSFSWALPSPAKATNLWDRKVHRASARQ